MNEIFDIVFSNPGSFVVDVIACLSLLCGCVGMNVLLSCFM